MLCCEGLCTVDLSKSSVGQSAGSTASQRSEAGRDGGRAGRLIIEDLRNDACVQRMTGLPDVYEGLSAVEALRKRQPQRAFPNGTTFNSTGQIRGRDSRDRPAVEIPQRAAAWLPPLAVVEVS